MVYVCNDCTYRGKAAGAAGECPACGSYGLQRKSVSSEEKPALARGRLAAVVVLWAVLLALITWKLVN